MLEFSNSFYGQQDVSGRKTEQPLLKTDCPPQKYNPRLLFYKRGGLNVPTLSQKISYNIQNWEIVTDGPTPVSKTKSAKAYASRFAENRCSRV